MQVNPGVGKGMSALKRGGAHSWHREQQVLSVPGTSEGK